MANYSINEILQFMRCRRMWDLTSQNRKGLVRIGGAPTPLAVGSALHSGLAANASGEDGLRAVADYVAEEVQKTREDYINVVGTGMSAEEDQRFKDIAGEAYAIAKRYFEFYGDENPIGPNFRYVVVETTFDVPIPRTKNHLIGTFDGIAQDVNSGEYWLVEHKTFSQQPNQDKMETDWQLQAYCWAAEKLFGQPLRGALYDGVSKKFHVKPKDLSEYFVRRKIGFSREALLQTEQFLQQVTRDMSDPKLQLYPNFRWEGCWDCSVRDLCKAIQFGEDVEFLIRNYYRRGSGHGTIRRLDRPRTVVDSFADLERVR